MEREEQIQKVLNSLYRIPGCPECGVRIRFGDLDCPRCGEYLEEVLRQWAEQLLDSLEASKT